MRRLILIYSAALGKLCEFATPSLTENPCVHFFAAHDGTQQPAIYARALRYMHVRLVARADSSEGQPQMELGADP